MSKKKYFTENFSTKRAIFLFLLKMTNEKSKLSRNTVDVIHFEATDRQQPLVSLSLEFCLRNQYLFADDKLMSEGHIDGNLKSDAKFSHLHSQLTSMSFINFPHEIVDLGLLPTYFPFFSLTHTHTKLSNRCL